MALREGKGRSGSCAAGHVNRPGASFCTICGQPIEVASPAPPIRERRSVLPPTTRPSRRPARLLAVAVLVSMTLVAIWMVAWTKGTAGPDTDARQDKTWWPSSDRATDCVEVSDQLEVCASPSRALVSGEMMSLVAEHCPALGEIGASNIVPLPWGTAFDTGMKVGTAGGIGTDGTSVIDGDPTTYTEEVAVGRGAEYAQLRRWVGGENDGLLDLNCNGSDDPFVANMSLKADQLNATLAAYSGASAAINFQAVIATATNANPDIGLADVPSPLAVCDSSGLDPVAAAPGATWTCTLKYYWQIPDFVAEFRSTGRAPWFEMIGPSEPPPPSTSAAIEQPPSTETPAEAGATSENAVAAPTCKTVADIQFDAGPQCEQALAVASRCGAKALPITMSFDTGGLAEWQYEGSSGSSVANTSFDADGGVGLLSCGDTGNGVDVSQLHSDVWKRAQDGWGIEVTSVACRSGNGDILDMLSPGESVASCAVHGADRLSSASYAVVSITKTAPHYEIHLAE